MDFTRTPPGRLRYRSFHDLEYGQAAKSEADELNREALALGQSAFSEAWGNLENIDGASGAVVVANNQAIGFCVVRDADKTLVLFRLQIAPLHRGNGYAQECVEDVLQWAQKEGYESLLVEVSDKHESGEKFWERFFNTYKGGKTQQENLLEFYLN